MFGVANAAEIGDAADIPEELHRLGRGGAGGELGGFTERLERDEVVGRPITDFFTEAEQRRFAGGHMQELLERGDFDNEDRRVVTKDGRVLDLVVSAIGHRDARGKVDRMLVASKDVTERLRTERRLRNALAENAIRPFAVGRRNWLFADTSRGAKASATMYSLIETAKASGLEPYQYLRHVLTHIGAAETLEQVEALLPWQVNVTDLSG